MSLGLKISGGLVALAYATSSALAVKAMPLPTYTKAELAAECTAPGEDFESTSDTSFSCSFPSGDVIACKSKKCVLITDKKSPVKKVPSGPRPNTSAPKSN